MSSQRGSENVVGELSAMLMSVSCPGRCKAGVSDLTHPLLKNRHSKLWSCSYGSSCMMLRVPHIPFQSIFTKTTKQVLLAMRFREFRDLLKVTALVSVKL